MKYIVFLLLLNSCFPLCRSPNLCLPTQFAEGQWIEPCGGEEVDLVRWWDQFHDPLLSQLIARSLCCNQDLRIARERICEARAVFGIEFSYLLPYVNAFTTFDRIRNSETLAQSPFAGGHFVSFFSMGFDTNWEVDLFGKNFDRAQAAAFDVYAQQEKLRAVHVSIASEVAATYFSIRAIQERIDITEKHIASEAALVDLVNSRFAAGLIPQLDIYTAKALLDARLATLPQLYAELYQTIYSLAVLLGEDPEMLLPTFCEKAPLPCTNGKIPLGLPSDLLCRRGDVREAEMLMLKAGAKVMAARKELFPTLSIKGIYEAATSFFTLWLDKSSEQWLIAPVLSLPLFHGGAIWSTIRVETSKQRQAVLAYEKSVLVALKELESALNNYFQEGVRLQSLDAEVADYAEARKLAEILYVGGISDFLYVITVERDLFLSQMEQVDCQKNVMTYLVAVYKALGGGWECCSSP